MTMIPFQITEWNELPVTKLPGESGFVLQRTRQYGELRIRMVEYSPGYKADHWCARGHILFCLDGEMDTELQDGTIHRLRAGMSYQVTDKASLHRSSTQQGARLFIVDGGFLGIQSTAPLWDRFH